MAEAQSNGREFPSHWSDSMLAWIDALPFPRWLFYVLLFASLGLTLNLIHWGSGVRTAYRFDPDQFIFGFWVTTYLLANHLLVAAGKNSLLRSGEPIYSSNEERERLLYRIGHISQGKGNLAILVGGLFGAFTALYAGRNLTLAVYSPLPVLIIFSSAGTAFFFLAAFRVNHQMNLIVRLLDSIKMINLYDLTPIYSVALFPVSIVFILLFTFWVNPVFLLFPDWLKDPLIQAIWIAISLGASLVVIYPLRGIAARLSREKAKLQKENAVLLDHVRIELAGMIRAGEHDRIGALEKEISALFAFQRSLENISTMPWKRETVRWLATALLLPLGLWVIQFFLQRVLGG